MMPNFGLLRHSADKHRINISPGCDLDGVFRLVSAVFRLAPPARFELALPPPESQRTMIWHDWNSTKPQVRPQF